MTFEPWRRVPGNALMFLLNMFTATALIFEGYNQAVLGTVSGTPGFIEMASIGFDGKVTNTTKQGGLAAAYYFGGIFGAFIGGWIGDKFGRKIGTFTGCVLAIIGSIMMCTSVDSNMFICARVITGLGIGFVNAIIPTWVSELSQAHDRGSQFSVVFVANFAGITIASWLNFGIRNSGIQFRWRFPLAFMLVPVLICASTVAFIPESPRWLIANGYRSEAIDILCKLRGDASPEEPKIVTEVEQLDAVVQASHHKRNDYINLFLGGRYSGKLHLGRRAVMGLALQQIQQWTGILVIVTWATKMFELAGFSPFKASWLGGMVNTFGIFGTLAACLVIDRLGRRLSLLISFIIQGVCLFLVAALIKTSSDYAESNPGLSQNLGTASSSFVFIFLFMFCMFNIVPCWIYGTEIWPQEVRAKGYSFTILGWAIGCGMTTFVIPIMLNALGWYTFIFFGAMNIIAMPIIYFFYVETANRSLEEMNLLFCSDSWLVSKNMAEYRRRVDAAGGNIAVAARQLLDEVDGTTHLDPRRISTVSIENGTGKHESHATMHEKKESVSGSDSA